MEKILAGKIEKFFEEQVLWEQAFVKDEEKTVGEYVQEKIGVLGENIQVKRFCRFVLGAE
jgi:elongation factor Ts